MKHQSLFITFLVVTQFLCAQNPTVAQSQTIQHYLAGTNKDATVPMGVYVYLRPQQQPLDNFEASMTDTEVKINGNLAGEPHEGGGYRFSYDITPLLRYGQKNRLEVKVAKRPANKSIYNAERQIDFWLFGGIYRPAFLEIKPQQHIQSIAIDARMDGTITVRPYLSPNTEATQVSMYVEELDSTRASEIVTAPSANDLHNIQHLRFRKPISALCTPSLPLEPSFSKRSS